MPSRISPLAPSVVGVPEEAHPTYRGVDDPERPQASDDCIKIINPERNVLLAQELRRRLGRLGQEEVNGRRLDDECIRITFTRS